MRDCGFADMVKSGAVLTVRDMLVVCEAPPLTPVTVIVYNPIVVEDGITIVSVEEPVPPDETGTLLGLTDNNGPAGKTEWDKDTVFANPKMLPREIVTKPD